MSATPDPTETPIPASLRAWWMETASGYAKADCVNLGLLPDSDRNLAKLPGELHRQLLEKIDALVTAACRREMDCRRRMPIMWQDLCGAIWDFLKPWGKKP